jgi:hypothetical protein
MDLVDLVDQGPVFLSSPPTTHSEIAGSILALYYMEMLELSSSMNFVCFLGLILLHLAANIPADAHIIT